MVNFVLYIVEYSHIMIKYSKSLNISQIICTMRP